jgi:uncharacterized protein YkwD
MAENSYFKHENLAGETVKDRLLAQNVNYYSSYSMAENIAAGQYSAIVAVDKWINSTSGHRDNLVGDFEYIGVGMAYNLNDTTQMVTRYTQDFYGKYVK